MTLSHDISDVSSNIGNNIGDVHLIERANGTLVIDPGTDSDEDGYTNSAHFQPSVINVDNSNDIIIGPVTQFHGPVTILQNPISSDDKSIQNTDSSSEQIHLQTKNVEPSNAKRRCNRRAKVFLVVFAFFVAIIIALIATFTIKPEVVDPSLNISGQPSKLGKHNIIGRGIWGGREPLNFTRPLPHPVDYVIISHTAGVFCNSFPACSRQMQQIQSLHVADGSPDIGYNFLIGGDANIYVGRGWDIINFQNDNCIGICFIGNYVYNYDTLSAGMIDAAKLLIKEGLEQGKLSKSYQLLAHNQTYPTQSPGENIYKEVKTWEHFEPIDYITWRK